MRRAWGWAALIAATVATLAAAAHAGDPLALRRLIATGDPVPRLGRVGEYGFRLAGLDDSGRALLVRGDYDGNGAFYWADEHGYATALDATRPAQQRALSWEFGWNTRGALAVRLAPAEPSWARADTLYVADPSGAGEVWASAGALDADGDVLCTVDAARINTAGQVAVSAQIATAGRACGERDESGDVLDERALYVFDDPARHTLAAARRVLHRAAQQRLDLVALADDGVAPVVVLESGLQLQRIDREGHATVIVGPDTRGADGAPLAWATILASNRHGDVLFVGYENGRAGLYRTRGTDIVRVFAEGDPAPPELPYAFALTADGWGSLSDFGDVLVGEQARALLFPGDGSAARLVGGIAVGGAVNDTGDVAIAELIADQVTAVTRWRQGAPTRLAHSGDVLPDGGVLADGGIGVTCAARDGRIGVALHGTDGTSGLACVDAAGTGVTAKVGDPAPGGRRFYSFQQCTFAAGDALVFTASTLVPTDELGDSYTSYRVEPSIYRASPERLERVIGPGDVASDGAVLLHLQAGDIDENPALVDADEQGRVLALATFSDEYGPAALTVREADGSLQRLPIALANGGGSWSGVGFPELTVIDHRFLSGETDVPSLPPFAAAGIAATAQASPASWRAVASGTDEPRYTVRQARLFGDGVIVLATERQYGPYSSYHDSPVVLVWSTGVLRRVFEAPQIDAGFSSRFGRLVVVGSRAAFLVPGSVPDRLFVYDDGDVVAREWLSPRPTVFGIPYLGLWRDGRSILSWSMPDGTTEVTAWDGTSEEVLLTYAVREWLDHVTPDALFVRDANSLSALAPPADPSAACPQPPTLVMATRTVTLPPSPTPTSSPTRAISAAPTRTPTASASPSPTAGCIAGAPCLHLGAAAGHAGGYATFTAALGGGALVSGTQNDLILPPVADLVGCSAGADTGKQALYRQNSDGARVLVLSLPDTEPIGDTPTLYRCTLHIASGAAPGRYALRCTGAGASDRRGNRVELGCTDGELVVSEAPTATATAPPKTPSTPETPAPTATERVVAAAPTASGTVAPAPAELSSGAGASSGCAVVAPGSSDAWPLALALLWRCTSAIAARRQRRRAAAASGS